MCLSDTHTHLHLDQYKEDLPRVLERAERGKISRILTLGTDLSSSLDSVKLANRFQNIYAAVGIHPTDVNHFSSGDVSEIKKLAKNEEKVVAIGEIGLDLYWQEVPLSNQLIILGKMIDLADELSLPVVVHNREAQQDMQDFFDKYNVKSLKGVMHSFSGNSKDAQFYLNRDLNISFTGVITFKNFKNHSLVKSIPLDRLLLETDSPFLAPEPYRGKRNEPAYVKYVAKQLSEIFHISLKEICQKTFTNAHQLFRW